MSSIFLLLFRLYLGYTFLTHGWQKISGGFDASDFLRVAIKNLGVEGWWASFLESVALPNIDLFNILVPWRAFLIGLGLILGYLTITATFFGAIMNFSFFFSGVTNPNALMALLAVFILVGGANTGKFSVDRWVLPYIRQFMNKKSNDSSLAEHRWKNTEKAAP